MMVSFLLSFFPRDLLDEILNLIGSVSEGFPSYSFITTKAVHFTKIEQRPPVLLYVEEHYFYRISVSKMYNTSAIIFK